MSKKIVGFAEGGGIANFSMRAVKRPVHGKAEHDGFEQLEDGLIPTVHASQESMRPLVTKDQNVLSQKQKGGGDRPLVRVDRSVLAYKHASASF